MTPPAGSPEKFAIEPSQPWDAPAGLAAVLGAWLASPKLARNLTLHERIPARGAHTTELPPQLHEGVRAALAGRGIRELYTHQAEAFAHALAGRDLVIATPTASGKSLCYNLPVLHALSEDPSTRALYMFPTKALARDQEAGLRNLLDAAGLGERARAITYDGDTPGDARKVARESSAIVLTNPDMLHAGILPHHTSWARLFAKLRYVVIDELHTYRGVFGSQLANVIRRLDRIARFHGSRPVFVLASATIGNPKQHAARMLGREVELIAESGAPQGPRRVLVYNPPVVNLELGVRESYIKAAVRLSADLVRAGVTTLLFGQSRNNVEVMLKYLRERLARDRIAPERVAAYRGGYLPAQRRAIEQALRAGELRCVVATSALELGIDIGALDAVVCAGYPGTLAGLWQRFGRGGRRGAESLALLVASGAPLDQYVAREPSYVIGAPIEHARIDPDNAEVLVQHLKCAAFELPFERGESFGNVPEDVVGDALEFLRDHGLLHAVPRGASTVFHWAADVYPANNVSLRSLGIDNFVIVDLERDVVVAEMDWRATHTMLHEQAIYQHDAEQYQVERLDFENHKAFVRKVDSDYFTTAMTRVKVSVLEVEERAQLALAPCGRGDVSVVEKVVGFKKLKYQTHENVGYGEVNLPEMQMHTTAFWLTVPEAIVERQPIERPLVLDALRGIANALHLVASVGLMADPSDLGHTLGDPLTSPTGPGARAHAGELVGFDPTIFFYDHVPGGVGLAPRLFEAREELLRRARGLIESCACEQGCPACVGPAHSTEAAFHAGVPSRKRSALALLVDLGISAVH